MPVSNAKIESPWLTTEGSGADLKGALGPSKYVARVGTISWLNGVYCVSTVAGAKNNTVMIENVPEAGKTSVRSVRASVEVELLYPMIRGKDAGRWCASISGHVVLPVDPRTGDTYAEGIMKQDFPEAYAYFLKFKKMLSERPGYLKYLKPAKEPFYAIYDVGIYSFAPYKVVWRQMKQFVNACVVSPARDKVAGTKAPILQHIHTFLGASSAREAHYLCAVMNSSLTSYVSSSSSTGKSFGTPALLENLSVPLFNAGDPVHARLSAGRVHSRVTFQPTRSVAYALAV